MMWAADKLGTLTTTFGAKNYSNVQEITQGSVVVIHASLREVQTGAVQ